MPPKLRLRSTLFALLCAGLLLPAGSQAAPSKGVALAPVRAHATQECQDADVTPTDANQPAVRQAILCLHNQIRAEHGLPSLREDARLRKAAVAHSADMVARRFFEHTTPGGATMVDRVMAARYASRNVGWALGENLAWGTGSLATPRGVVKAWMDSHGHRANILKRSYREVGIGVVTGTPTGGDAGATYTADFGVIRR